MLTIGHLELLAFGRVQIKMLEKQKRRLKMVVFLGTMVCLLQLYLAQNFNFNLVRHGANIISNYGKKLYYMERQGVLILIDNLKCYPLTTEESRSI